MANVTLAQYWHPIARSEEVGDQPGAFTLLGERLVAFRAEQGVSVFDDLCIHRGTALSLGWIEDGHLTCAYHGWQYDHTGACVRIPSLSPSGSIPRKARAIVHPVQERYGLVWVALGEPASPLPGWPRGEIDDPRYRWFISYDLVWNTSAGRAVENFMDPTHFPFVHEGMLGTRDRTEAVPHPVAMTDYGATYGFEQEEPATLHSAAGERITWKYDLYTPFTIHLSKLTPAGEETLISLVAAPIDETQTRLFVFIVRNYQLTEEEDGPFRDFTNTIMEQDRVIVESQRPERIPLDLREELHLKVPDASGIAYRTLLSRIDMAAAFMP